MNVLLVRHDPHALNLLLRTKNTRLGFASDPASWSDEERHAHLAYMKDTIKSSWEFVDYVFEISGVTRAFTHQLVRTRAGSYAQESQRAVDVSDRGWLTPAVPKHPIDSKDGRPIYNGEVPRATSRNNLFDDSCRASFMSYAALIENGMQVQDARGVLPTATLTSITAKFNLRTLHEMAKVRLCTRTQGEYQEVFRTMRALVVKAHPWVGEFGFIEVQCVAEGTCAFPRYGRPKCKFWDDRLDRTEVSNDIRARFWTESPQVANPVAREGKTT